MKQQALEIAAQAKNPSQQLNLLREYLQAFALRALHESEAFLPLSFVGGTALRFLYNLPRFSEDLNFSLESKQRYDPDAWMKKLKRDLDFAGFVSTVSWKSERTVAAGWIKVSGLLKEVGLSGEAQHNLSIKIEVDQKPPQGARMERTIVNRHFLVAFQHHDLPSLMAGKIAALLCRPYVKGRDWYDLMWYLARRPAVQPNLELMQNAILQQAQNQWDVADWQNHLLKKIAVMDWKKLRADVAPFLERPEEIEMLTKELFQSILRSD